MNSVIVPTFTFETRSTVLKMLGLKNNAFKDGLVRVLNADKEESGKHRILLHYDVEKLEKLQSKDTFSNKELNEIAALAAVRGIIIDLKSMRIIKRSFPQTVNIPTAFVPRNMLNPITTSTGDVVPEWGIYKSCMGGTLLHSYWYEGQVYLSSFKHFDVSNSHFGDSDNFVESFLKNQEIYSSLQDLYPPGSDLDVVHVFILNDRKLLIDTRENQLEDRVIYLKSFSMVDPSTIVNLGPSIIEANKTVDKPILFCNEMTPDQVNDRLKGTNIDVSDDYTGDRYGLLSRFKNFFGGEKVIYEHSLGICTLVPPSCKARQAIMEGKNNISKLFVDCMADAENVKGLADVAFSLDDCLAIAEKLQMNETIYVDDYRLITDNKQLEVLTNLLFIVPLNRIPEVISAYSDFDKSLIAAVNNMIESFDELEYATRQDKLATYPGITSKKFRAYLCEHLPNLAYNEVELNNHWPEVLQKLFGVYYKAMCNPDATQEQLVRIQINMGLIELVGNAYGDLLYTFLTFEEKARKSREAAVKRNSK